MTGPEFVERQMAQFAASLDPVNREYFESMLTPSARERLKLPASTLRTRQRDDLARWICAERWPNGATRLKARELHAALTRYAGTGWPRHTGAGTRPLNDERYLHRLLDLCDGEVISEGSIRRILS